MGAKMNALAHVKAEEMFQAQSVTADALGAAKDITKYEGVAAFILSANHIGGTTPTCDVSIVESDTSGGTYTAVPSGAFTQVTTTDSFQTLKLNLDGRKKFLKANVDVGGTSPDYRVAVVMAAFEKYLT